MEDILKSYTAALIRYEVTLKAMTNIPTTNQVRITWKTAKATGKTKPLTPGILRKFRSLTFTDGPLPDKKSVTFSGEVVKFESIVYQEKDGLAPTHIFFDFADKVSFEMGVFLLIKCSLPLGKEKATAVDGYIEGQFKRVRWRGQSKKDPKGSPNSAQWIQDLACVVGTWKRYEGRGRGRGRGRSGSGGRDGE